jgi:hypothetical protein
MNNEIDCNHLFPKKVHDYIFGDAYKECLKCGEIINSCEYARAYKEKKEKQDRSRFEL